MCTLLTTILSDKSDLDTAGRCEIVGMIHKGVEYTVTAAAPGTWKWQFRIGDRIVSGKTEARLQLLAIRRVQLRIDRELKKAERD